MRVKQNIDALNKLKSDLPFGLGRTPWSSPFHLKSVWLMVPAEMEQGTIKMLWKEIKQGTLDSKSGEMGGGQGYIPLWNLERKLVEKEEWNSFGTWKRDFSSPEFFKI